MVFSRFSLRIVIQIILIGITSLIFSWSLMQDHLSVARFTFAALFIIQIILLIDYIKSSNRSFFRFMELIKNQGLMERFEQVSSLDSNENLNQVYNEIMQLIANSKIEKEGEHLYFLQTLEIIGTSIISIDEKDKIDLINKAARELLKIESIRSLNQLKEIYPEFVKQIIQMQNEQEQLFKLQVGESILMLKITCSHFSNQDKKLRLYSFQNISLELENEELDAWQKLIKVLRHEIMNSITPIHSLTNTVIRLLSEKNNTENTDKALEGLHAINKRNKGLLKFVESYRNLTKIPEPVFEKVAVGALFDNINILFSDEIRTKKISFSSTLHSENLSITVDEKLITQVLINLIKNSIEALYETQQAEIKLEALAPESGQVIIKVMDNGLGIAKEDLDKVFVPFYTTKEMGSGIGLSLSRQIVRMNKGSISVHSSPGKETIFTLKF